MLAVSLPQADLDYLVDRAIAHEVTVNGSMVCVVLRGYPIPPGYDRSQSDLLLRLSAGYPDVPPDMWWFDPPVRLPGGSSVQATEQIESHLGRSWQRWSRHLNPGQWQSGVDCLETFLALIRKELANCARVAVQ